MESIDYKPLNSSHFEIRLLTLLSEGSSGPLPLTFSLRTVRLLENPSYVALSYTWGKPDLCKTIQINGKAVAVRANLEAALSHIQRETDTVSLWVDAICINQDDDDEKSQQVQIMRDIYAKAQYVLAWLGIAAHESDKAMDLLNAIGERAIEARILDLQGKDLENLFNPGEDERLSSILASLDSLAETAGIDFFHPSLADFSEREYWKRTWIVQEVCVAGDVVLMCGSKKLPLRTFSAASNFCGFARQRRGRNLTMEEWRDPVRGPVYRAWAAAKAPSSAPNMVFGIRRRQQGETGIPISVLGLLKRTCFERPVFSPLKATDGRDKVYGLLGLDPSSEQLGLSPDYTKTIQEVYTAATRALIATGEVNILAWSQRHKIVKDLPSWVPDFSSPLRPPCGENDRVGCAEQIYYASGRHGVTILTHENPNVIGLRGVSIDSIKLVGTPWMPVVNGAFDYKAQTILFDEIEQFTELAQAMDSKAIKDIEWGEAKWRIPCADQEGKYSGRVRASSAIHAAYLDFRHTDTNRPRAIRDACLGYMKVMSSLYERRPFLSLGGLAGLVPAHAQHGDLVCIILGGNFPFILRRKSEGQYELVGEAYVHGMMDGEGLELGMEIEPMWLR